MGSIKIAATPPIANQELAELGDLYFCLAQHYLNNTDYRKFFNEKVKEGAHVILDNGAGDYEQIPRAELAWATRELRPTEVIPIDIIGNGHKTWEELKLAKSWVPNGVKILACPQGDSLGDYIDCFQRMMNEPAIHRVAISKIAATDLIAGEINDEHIESARPKLFSALAIMGLIKKKIHLLGLGSLRELRRYNHWVTSADSCMPIWAAMNNQEVDNGYKRIPTPKDYFERQVYDGILALKNVHNIQENVWRKTHEYTQPTKEELKYEEAMRVIFPKEAPSQQSSSTAAGNQLDLF